MKININVKPTSQSVSLIMADGQYVVTPIVTGKVLADMAPMERDVYLLRQLSSVVHRALEVTEDVLVFIRPDEDSAQAFPADVVARFPEELPFTRTNAVDRLLNPIAEYSQMYALSNDEEKRRFLIMVSVPHTREILKFEGADVGPEFEKKIFKNGIKSFDEMLFGHQAYFNALETKVVVLPYD